MQDWVLVAVLVGVSVLITFALSSIYYAQRVYELRREHVEEMQEANQELINARLINSENMMQARVLGAMPVSRLIGGGNDE
ncbi:MAG: hypothetical protein DRH08_12890 [Deltaproteobacteria bacterium]|nr:MAG: hypothetical protein DRH08_12890 [Deltaproteobacteria bacterium]